MVAYTHPDCLPFFECADSPCLNTGTTCDPSTVWCDMAAALEITLNSFDSTVQRTGMGVPLAKVARSAPQVDSLAGNFFGGVGPAFPIQWDTVVMDNDNMVNLDVDSQFVRINRPGIWWMELYVVGIPDTTPENELHSYLLQRGPTVNRIPGTVLSHVSTRWRSPTYPTLSSTPPFPRTTQNRLSYATSISAADLATNLTIDIQAAVQTKATAATADPFQTVSYAEMTIYWTAEPA